VRSGVGHVPEGRQLSPLMSVRENLDAGANYLPAATADAERTRSFVCDPFPRLRERERLVAAAHLASQPPPRSMHGSPDTMVTPRDDARGVMTHVVGSERCGSGDGGTPPLGAPRRPPCAPPRARRRGAILAARRHA